MPKIMYVIPLIIIVTEGSPKSYVLSEKESEAYHVPHSHIEGFL